LFVKFIFIYTRECNTFPFPTKYELLINMKNEHLLNNGKYLVDNHNIKKKPFQRIFFPLCQDLDQHYPDISWNLYPEKQRKLFLWKEELGMKERMLMDHVDLKDCLAMIA